MQPIAIRLGNYLLELGLYRQAIYAIRQVLTLAGLDDHADSLNVPKYFSHIRYGMYYPDIVIPAAKKIGFDPLISDQRHPTGKPLRRFCPVQRWGAWIDANHTRNR